MLVSCLSLHHANRSVLDKLIKQTYFTNLYLPLLHWTMEVHAFFIGFSVLYHWRLGVVHQKRVKSYAYSLVTSTLVWKWYDIVRHFHIRIASCLLGCDHESFLFSTTNSHIVPWRAFYLHLPVWIGQRPTPWWPLGCPGWGTHVYNISQLGHHTYIIYKGNREGLEDRVWI